MVEQNGLSLEKLEFLPEGLSAHEAETRLEQYGKNALEEKKKKPLLQRIWEQISDPMVLVLIVAAIVSGALGEIADTVIILVVVVINTCIGLVQENKAEQAIAALKKMSAQTARVIRGGELMIIPSELLVPGDTVVLEAGDLVPADLRLYETSSMKIEEASLTGESVPSEKDARAEVPDGSPLGDQKNKAFYGTSVTYGRGRGTIFSTGMGTEMGKIAAIINKEEDQTTPLQKKLAEIGKLLTYLVIAICVVIFLVGLFRGGFTIVNSLDSFMIAISLAVAAIPEGLPAVVTIVMALGVTRMARRNAIVKKLPAVETLGCAKVICSDKTGTLTQNKMNVRSVYMDEKIIPIDDFVAEEGFNPLFATMYLCNDSELRDEGDIGDPTETALKRCAAERLGVERFTEATRIEDKPFDSDRKMMSTMNKTSDGDYVFTKGAPDMLLKCCDRININGEIRPLSEEDISKINEANAEMAHNALRVLGAAYKPYIAGEEPEEGLIFAGLSGMIDPPRPEVYDAIKKCRKAGIIPIMITGDHKDTAVAIAEEIGLLRDGDEAVFGHEIDAWNDEEFLSRLEKIRVYARVSPEHKVRIVRAWKSKNMVVAMTGDGVNDAPALKTSDIGIGMGITGTDVTKDVADVLLADDNFATIVDAVHEGRKIYNNIRKTVQFLLSSNSSEVLTLFIATLLLPAGVVFLGPVHILWINLVTDSLPAIGIGMDKEEPGIMEIPPRDANKSFFADGLGIAIAYQGLLMAALVLLSYAYGNMHSHEAGTTMAFMTLSIIQIFQSFNMKAGKNTVFSKNSFNNRFLLLAGLLPILLMVLIVNIKPIADIFNVVALGGIEWLICLGLSFMIIPCVEIIKVFQRMYHKSKHA